MLRFKPKNIVLFTSLFCFGVNINAQQLITGNTIILDEPDQGDKIYMADERIEFLPGYSYEGSSSDKMEAFITPSHKQMTDYNSLFSNSDFASHSIDENYEVGTLNTGFDVTELGSFTYNVPLELPKGANDMTPDLEIVYNSLGGSDILGVGWSLSGLSSIKRMGKPIYLNDKQLTREYKKGTSPIQSNFEDMFALNGSTLIAINGNYGSNGTVYGFEEENFTRIKSIGVQGNGPREFELTSKNGLKIKYGGKVSSRLMNNQTVMEWHIDKIIDQKGNFINFIYDNYEGQIVLTEIEYSCNENSPSIHCLYKVHFNYNIRLDGSSNYIDGIEVLNNYLLKSIEVSKGGNRYKEYNFEYGFNLNSYLNKITKKVNGKQQFNPLIFRYGNNIGIIQSKNRLKSNNMDITQPSNVKQRMVGEFNRDGLSDIVSVADQSAWGEAPYSTLAISINKALDDNSNNDFESIYNNIETTSSYITASRSHATLSNSLSTGLNVSDFDGDGLSDITYFTTSHTGSESSSGEFIVTSRWIDGFKYLKSEVNSQGQVEFSEVTTTVNPQIPNYIKNINNFYFRGDFNGDGIEDIIFSGTNQAGNVARTYLVHGQEDFNQGFLPFGVGQSHQRVIGANFESLDLVYSDQVYPIDFDGDGKTELMVITNNNVKIFRFDIREHLTNPEVNYAELIYEDTWSNTNDLKIGDFNGDGKTDFLVRDATAQFSFGTQYEYKIKYSTGRDFVEDDFSFPGVFGNVEINGINQEIYTFDFNGDGNDDIVKIIEDISNNRVNIVSNFSNGKTFYSSSQYVNAQGTVNEFFIESPLIGRFKKEEGMQIIIPYKSGSFNYLMRIDCRNTADDQRLIDIKDGFNNRTSISYNTNYNDLNKDYVHPFYKLTIPLATTESVKFNNNNQVNERKFKFTDGVVHSEGKKIIGFKSSEANNVVFDELVKFQYDLNEDKSFLYLEKEELFKIDQNNNLNLLEKTELNYEFSNLSNKRYSYTTKEELITDEFKGIQTNISYDNDLTNGNVLKITKTTDNIETIETIFDYDNFGNPYGFLNEVTSKKEIKTYKNNAPFETITNFDYNNSTGEMTEKVAAVGTPFEKTEKYNYDIFGNVIETRVISSNFDDKVEKVQYDTYGVLPVVMINDYGQSSFFEYDYLFNAPSKVIDVNGLETKNKYDNFGNLVETEDFNGNITYLAKEWVNTDPPAANNNFENANDIMWKKTEISDVKPNKTIFYNCLNQERKIETDRFGGDKAINVFSYNSKGVKVAMTDLFFQGSQDVIITEKEYDKYNRIEKITYNEETTVIDYQQNNGELTVTQINPDNSESKKVYDATGHLVTSEDDGGVINYSYFSHGDVKEIEKDGEVIASSTYDQLGRKASLDDQNAGSFYYEYNEFDQLTKSVDANGNEKTYKYNSKGELEEENINDGEHIINHEYILSGNGVNKKSKIISNNHSVEYNYDYKDRLVGIKEVIDGQEFEFVNTYNGKGQVSSLTYPNGLIINSVYDNNGYLTEVKDQYNKTLWEAGEQDAHGRFIEYTKGDDITTNLFYDGFQNLEGIWAGNIQQHIYTWDEKSGNLRKREDLVNQLYEEFEYDNLNRLTKAQDEEIAMGPPPTIYSEVEYEDNGNISFKSDAGDYAYHPTKPNAVTNVSNENENISLLTQDISYNALNKASSITEGDYTLQFLYGHDKQRRKTSFYDDNGLAMEKYFVGLYEKEIDHQTGITRHINYITAGDGMTAIVLQEEESGNTTEDTYFTYKDHLGSIVALTDESGDVVLEQSFDAWGRYRNPHDWSYNILNPSPTWLRGYTGHEHLPHFDLVNMNGRIYDPILGRMLSPDRFVQSPGYSQSYNRYSYCWNNPLRYTDPSGDIVLGPIIAFAVAGAITNVMLDRYDEDFSFMGSALKGAAFGAAIGSGVAWAATAMGAAGAIATTGALKAKKISAQLIGGMNNALYNYESNQSFLVSSGYFLSGMLGTAIGTGMAGAESGRVVLGMMSNAALNPLIAWADKNTDMDEYGLVATQKIIGGALNTFQSTAMYNTDLTYMGFENNSLGKGLNYAAQAVASEFAYTKAEGWNDLNYALYPFKASAGFVSGIVNYEINKINFDGRQKEFWQVGLTALSKGLATASFNYLWDYGFQHNTSSVDGGALTDYDGRWQKQRISFNKFVGVTLQTIFEPYD